MGLPCSMQQWERDHGLFEALQLSSKGLDQTLGYHCRLTGASCNCGSNERINFVMGCACQFTRSLFSVMLFRMNREALRKVSCAASRVKPLSVEKLRRGSFCDDFDFTDSRTKYQARISSNMRSKICRHCGAGSRRNHPDFPAAQTEKPSLPSSP